jgi:catechol 2,3-dioxygenase-like lactoylglutathione lyase family enzyme
MSQQATSIVTGIDHVNVATSDPQGLAEILQRVLGLTEAWPFTDYGAFVSVGLMAGTSSTIAVDRSDGDIPFLVPPRASAGPGHRQEWEPFLAKFGDALPAGSAALGAYPG